MFFQPLPTDTFWQHCRWIPTAWNCCNQASMVTPVTSELDVTVSVLDVHHVKPTCLFVINLTNSTVPGWNSRLLCPPQMLPLCCHQTSWKHSGVCQFRHSERCFSVDFIQTADIRPTGSVLCSIQLKGKLLLWLHYPVVTDIFKNMNIIVDQIHLQCVIWYLNKSWATKVLVQTLIYWTVVTNDWHRSTAAVFDHCDNF